MSEAKLIPAPGSVRKPYACVGCGARIGFRMLQPHELAAAQGFPRDYRFAGTKTEVVKQIGNAVPCGLARALVSAALAA